MCLCLPDECTVYTFLLGPIHVPLHTDVLHVC